MPLSSSRPVPSIDAHLRSYSAFRRDAGRELAEVRRRLVELTDLEAALIVAMEVRATTADRMLEERLRATATVSGRPPSALFSGERRTVPASDERPTGATVSQPVHHAPR